MDFSRFEKLHGEMPFLVMSRHPDETLIAMQVVVMLHTTAWRSAVWDVQTGKIIWAPEDSIAIAWLREGKEIGLIREQYRHRPELHGIIGSPLQSEFTYIWERRSWPEQTLLSVCSIQMPTGWPTCLAISPRSDLAVFHWRDQCESGLEFISISTDGDRQILETGFPILENVTPLCFRPNGNGFPLPIDLTTEPVFSPDGRYIVIGWQEWFEWWKDEHDDDDTPIRETSTPARGGTYHLGAIEVLDWDTRGFREIPLIVEVLDGWLPPPAEDESGWLIRDLAFIDDRHIIITLPTGETRTYPIPVSDQQV